MRRMRGRASVTPARFSLAGIIEDAETDRGALALAVWIYSALWGTVIGAIGGFVALIAGTSSWGFGWIILNSLAAAVLAAGFGFMLGNIIGGILALIVHVSPLRARVGIVTIAIPVVALTVSVAATILLFGAGGGGTAVVAVDAVLTLAGAIWICHRYRVLERTFDEEARSGVGNHMEESRVH
jgi:hypothetical protein